MSDPLVPKTEFTAELAGSGGARGSLFAIYRPTTHVLEWRLSFSGLGDDVVSAEFRGPGPVGVVTAQAPINGSFEGGARRGGTTLTSLQAADLRAGRWSVVVKTAAFHEGEIGGSLVPASR